MVMKPVFTMLTLKITRPHSWSWAKKCGESFSACCKSRAPFAVLCCYFRPRRSGADQIRHILWRVCALGDYLSDTFGNPVGAFLRSLAAFGEQLCYPRFHLDTLRLCHSKLVCVLWSTYSPDGNTFLMIINNLYTTVAQRYAIMNHYCHHGYLLLSSALKK